MDLNKSKMKNRKALLELKPNFPGVATPQSSEWFIYIVSYAYNPFTAPWGDQYSRARVVRVSTECLELYASVQYA